MPPGLGAHVPLRGRQVRIGHWNVYWKALNDAAGQRAIKVGIDAAVNERGPFDFFAMLEASGSGSAASFPEWVQTSKALQSGGPMNYIHGRSFPETIALFYRSEQWEPIWFESSEFSHGRPFVTGLFKLRDEEDNATGDFFSCADAIWVVGAHLPHYTSTHGPTPRIGDHLRDILVKGASITGCMAPAMPTIIVGDFNEFGECSVPPHVQCSQDGFRRAAASLQPLWDYLGVDNVADAADTANPTCCTKWHENVHNDWWHHYDHMYYTGTFLNISKPAEFTPYRYPGVPSCSGPSCTGPLNGMAPRSQGSWHRGWQATFTPKGLSEKVLAV